MTVKHLFDAWDEIIPMLQKRLPMLFLDYDGTLTRLRDRPESAVLSARAKKILKELSRRKRLCLGIVSGRSISALKKMVRIPGIIYAGNHGLEIEGPRGLRHTHPAAKKARKLLKQIASDLRKNFRPVPAVLVEDKHFSLSVHYRMVPKARKSAVRLTFSNTLLPYLKNPKIELTEGNQVWEIRPRVLWNKGSAVLWLSLRGMLQAREIPFPIFIGDDRTDEDAFEVLKRKGLGIRVTAHPRQPTEAAYYLRSPAEVFLFLKLLNRIKVREEELSGALE